MQAGKTKAERYVTAPTRAAFRPTLRKYRKELRKVARATAAVQAASWESVAKVYASPEHIAKVRAIHKSQCESLAASKIKTTEETQ